MTTIRITYDEHTTRTADIDLADFPHLTPDEFIAALQSDYSHDDFEEVRDAVESASVETDGGSDWDTAAIVRQTTNSRCKACRRDIFQQPGEARFYDGNGSALCPKTKRDHVAGTAQR